MTEEGAAKPLGDRRFSSKAPGADEIVEELENEEEPPIQEFTSEPMEDM